MRTSHQEIMEYLDNALYHYEDECILWPYQKANGYPRVQIDLKKISVHRMACEHVNGPPPFVGAYACHNCNNKLCINPSHLRWDTPSGNQKDRLDAGTDCRGEKHGAAKLRKEDIMYIRNNADIISQRKLAKIFDISRKHISRIIKGESWGWMTSFG